MPIIDERDPFKIVLFSPILPVKEHFSYEEEEVVSNDIKFLLKKFEGKTPTQTEIEEELLTRRRALKISKTFYNYLEELGKDLKGWVRIK